MKHVIVSIISLLILSASLAAEVPHLINYQGILADDSGVPLDGTYDLTFNIYGDSLSATSLWAETHVGVEIDQGLFSLMLGSETPIGDSLFTNGQRWLGISVEPDAELAPRMMMTSVPWALRAEAADTASSVAWSAITGMPAGFADGVDDSGGVAESYWLESGDNIYRELGNIGIGTAGPAEKLDIRIPSSPGSFEGMGIRSGSPTTGYPTIMFKVGSSEVARLFSHQGGQHLYLDTQPEKGNIFLRPEQTEMMAVTPEGVGIGTTGPTEMLDVAGNVKATAFIGDGSLLTGLPGVTETDPTVPDSIKDGIDWSELSGVPVDLADGDDVGVSYWSESGDDIYRDLGNVGIGTAGPAEKLDIRIPSSPGSFEGMGIRSGSPTTGYPTIMFKVGSSEVARLFSHQGGQHLYLDTQPEKGNIFLRPEQTEMMAVTPEGVGIGTTGPTEMLDVAGNLKVGGMISMDTVTRYLSLSGSALMPSTDTTSFVKDEYGLQSLESVYVSYIAPVNLPHGAVVTELKCWVYDNDPSGTVDVTLLRVALSGSDEADMAQIASSDSPLTQELTDGTIDYATIDNQNFLYILKGEATRNTHKFISMLITYTINKPLP